jgi:hypothetical protein
MRGIIHIDMEVDLEVMTIIEIEMDIISSIHITIVKVRVAII